jgi:DNA invertase Pin-like site-specific DNA recombinase
MLHRKNALFYRTLHSAEAGDLFMSLIHTCELTGANPFDYLTELQRHASELAKNPSAWMPWNFLEQTQPAASQRELRETLLATARRREIDEALVWRLDRWGRSVTDLVSTL